MPGKKTGETSKAIQHRYNSSPLGRFRAYKRGAKIRRLPFSINLAYFTSFWNKPCGYCGELISGVGIDRIDNARGYVPGNLIASCRLCNLSKSNMSHSDYIAHCICIAQKYYPILAQALKLA